ncbi:DUF3310 domain-containing protein [Streptomyces violascens]|uniref:DUF3310 domain-containing protein n=1 Tax=Streptomyces violascens TaxID=67381 RepID=UPI003651D87B
MPRFKIGDKVYIAGAPGQIAGWLYEDKRGVVQAVYEGQPYPNDVHFADGSALCFADAELRLIAEESPGRRLLNETNSLAFGIDPHKGQEVMKSAVSPNPEVKTTNSAVSHPLHYTRHPSGIECINVAKHMNFPLGNAIKYIWRAEHKGSTLEDLEKAKQYIDIEIGRLKEMV